MKIRTLFFVVFIFFFLGSSLPGQAQTAGDYRSATTGQWTTLATWQRYSGTAWATPTAAQGYPGQYVGTGVVSILEGHTVTIGSGGITTQSFSRLSIAGTGQLYLTGASSTVIFSLATNIIDISSGGSIYFANKARLTLNTNAAITLAIGPGSLTGSCNNNDEIYIGTAKYAVCAGAPGDIFTFAQLMSGGGTLNAIPSSNSPICQGSTINLSGTYSGAIGTSPTYSWSVTAPGGGVTVYPTQNPSITSAVTGTYLATLTVTTVLNGTTYTNAETISVVVNPLPTLSGATQPVTICDGSPAAINLTGLIPSTTFSLNYTINSVPQTQKTGLVASSGGTSSFTTPALSASNNGQTLQVTGITITSSSTNCSQTFAQNVTLSVWTTGAGTWTGTTSSDWNTASNWCGGSVPTASTDVFISPNSASVLNQPVIGTAGGICKNITINSGATVTISASNALEVKGNWTNNGTFTPNSGTVSFTGSTAAQTIGGTGTNAFNNLTINNTYSGGGVKAASNITVNGILNLEAANPSATAGALDMASNWGDYPLTFNSPFSVHTLTMGANATTIGQGDVTGKIYRGTVSANTAYSFGNQFTNYSFTVAPTDVTVIVTIGTAWGASSPTAWGSTTSVKRSYEMIPTGGTGARVTMNLHYLDSELQGNTEQKLVTGDYDISDNWCCGSPTGDEHGRSSYDFTNNFIGLSGVPISYFIYVDPDHKWRTVFTLHDYSEGFKTWLGTSGTGWNTEANWDPWGIPTESHTVIIPDVATDPVLSSDVQIGGIRILSGGYVDFSAKTITLSGYNYSGWEDQSGLSNYAGSTIVINNTTVATPVSGIPHFNNLTINSGACVLVSPNSHIYISGNLTKTGTLDAGTFDNIFDYNGAAQTVAMPDGNGKYYNLTLSGSGAKTLPGSALTLLGNLELSGTATAAPTNSLTIMGNLTLGSGTTFTAGSLTHSLAGNFLNNGGTFTNTGSTINLNGTTAQTLGGTASTSFNNLTVNNASGVTLNIDETVDGTLTLTSGLVTTGSYTLTSGSASSITGAGSSSYVNGKLARIYSSAGSKDFPIGKGGNYRQVTLNYTALTGTSTVTAEQVESTITGSLPANTTVQSGRSWSITESGSTSRTYSLTLNGSPFTPGTGTAKVIKGDGSTNTSFGATYSPPDFTATGLTSFSYFAAGSECPPPEISAHPAANASCEGAGTPQFTVSVSGSGLSYQWQESPTGTGGTFTDISDGGVYSNSTTVALTITNPPYSMNGYAYRVVIRRDCGSEVTSDPAVLTVNALPTITLGSSPAVCSGITTADLSYSGPAGSPDQYTIDYDTDANTAGFVDVTLTDLPTSPITLTLPGSASGTFNGSLTIKNSTTGCTSTAYPFTVTLYALPQGALTGNVICSGEDGKLTWTATSGSGPFTVVYNDGTADRTVNNVASGTAFDVFTDPTTTTGYTLVSVTGSHNCPRTSGFTGGTGTVTVLTSATSFAWDGSESEDWHTAANWTPAFIPVSCTDVTIPFSGITNFPTIYADAECNNITVESGASLLDNGFLSVNGSATVKREIASDFKWHFLSAPVTAQPIWPEFAPTPGGDPLSFGADTVSWDFYYWNPNANASSELYWVNLCLKKGFYNSAAVDLTGSNAGFGTLTPPVFTPGRGYLVSYTSPWNTMRSFTGSLNTGPVAPAVTYNPVNVYNLLGNPYPSSIDWKAEFGWDRSDLHLNGTGYDYWVFNDGVGTYGVFNSAGSSGTNGVTRYIAPEQAFFVKVTSTGSLGMNDNIRVHSSQSWLKNSEAESNLVKLRITTNANSYSDEMILEFNPAFIDGGSSKFFSMNAEAPEIYAPLNGSNYSIIRQKKLAENQTFPVCVKTEEDAGYTITAVDVDEFSLASGIFLEDRKTGAMQDLKINPSYSFAAKKGEDRNRFLLHFGGPTGAGDENAMPGYNIYASENVVSINNLSGRDPEGKVRIFSILGQKITDKVITENHTRITLDVPTGWYLITMVTNKETIVRKVFIH